jgi:type II secretory pathway component GspD/PulD (secretin)
MRCIFSHLNCWGLILGMFFLSPFHSLYAADDIDIDLGGSGSSGSKTNSSPVATPQNQPQSLANQMKVGQSEVNTTSDTSVISSELKNSTKVFVDKINVSLEGNGTKVEINGNNLSLPSVEKVSDKKILIKLPKTKLRIPSKIVSKKGVLKDIRSSVHAGGMTWIVLDVTTVKKWDLEKTESGYSLLLLNSDQDATSGAEIKNVPVSNDEVDIKGNSSDKRLFFRLIDLSFKPIEKGIKIVLTSDGLSKYTVRKLSQPEKLVIRFHDTKLEIADKLKRFKNNDPELKKGGLLLVEMRQIGPPFSPISEAILTLLPGTIHQIDRDLNQVVVTLSAPEAVEKPVEKKGNINQLVSMDIEGADLSAVIRTLASEAGFDVDFPPTAQGGTSSSPVTGTVNEKFKDVPLKTALATLLSPGGFDYEIQGNTLRVASTVFLKQTKGILPHVTELIAPSGGMTPVQFDALVRAILKPSNAVLSTPDPVRNMLVLNGTVADIEDYKKTIRDLKLDESSNSDRITRVVKLNYADPVQTQTILNAYLTPVGKVQVDPRSSSLVIWETATNMGVLLELIKEIDVKVPQVLIESNIVEVDDEKDLNFGINWTGTRTTGDPQMGVTFNNPAGAGNGGGIPGQFGFATLRSGLNINATLSALEVRNKAKIISRPKVATQSGVAAEMNSVENLIVETFTQTAVQGAGFTTTVSFSQVALPIDLKVTPRITDDGRITTIINATVTSQTGSQQAADGTTSPPPTSVQTATTTVTIKNGETIVIGGLVRDTVNDTVNGIPLLSSLPILGALFQQKTYTHKKTELVIFITPTILED